MQAQRRTPAERAMAERYRSPEAVMRETASSQVFSIDKIQSTKHTTYQE
jgi:hypothetical protein